MSGFAGLFLLFDGVMKLFKPPMVVQSTLQLGYPESTIVAIGVVLLVCTVLYLTPRTSALGAILLTGYLGGAVASHVRARDSWFDVSFPGAIGALVWGGLWLRDQRLSVLLIDDARDHAPMVR